LHEKFFYDQMRRSNYCLTFNTKAMPLLPKDKWHIPDGAAFFVFLIGDEKMNVQNNNKK